MLFLKELACIALVLLSIVFIALIISSSAGSMFFPRSEAHPAEVIITLGAVDMITSLVLFNRQLALRTGLCVGDNPSDIF